MAKSPAQTSRPAGPEKAKSWEKGGQGAAPALSLKNQLIFFTDTQGNGLAYTKAGFVPSEGLPPYLLGVPAGGFQKDDIILDALQQKWKVLQRIIEPVLSRNLPPRTILVINLLD